MKNILQRSGDKMIKYFKILLATATAKKTDRWIKIDSLITSKIVKNFITSFIQRKFIIPSLKVWQKAIS